MHVVGDIHFKVLLFFHILFIFDFESTVKALIMFKVQLAQIITIQKGNCNYGIFKVDVDLATLLSVDLVNVDCKMSSFQITKIFTVIKG